MPNGFLGPKPPYHAPKRTACRSGIAPFRTHDCMDYDGAARKIGCGCTDHVKRTMSTSDDLRCSELNHWPKKISSTVPSLVDAQHSPRCRLGCELEQVSWSVLVIMMSILVALLERGDNHVCRGCRCAGRSFTGQNLGEQNSQLRQQHRLSLADARMAHLPQTNVATDLCSSRRGRMSGESFDTEQSSDWQ